VAIADQPNGAAPGGRPPARGLTLEEVSASRARFGANRFVPEERAARLRRVLSLVADPMALMLGAASSLYFLAGDVRDGVTMLVAIVPVLGVDVVLEARAQAALRAMAERTAIPARVVRDGVERDVPSEDVVVGDTLILVEGDVVHADGVVRAGANLALDEAVLTGEAEPSAKVAADAGAAAADDARVFAGSVVAAGHGRVEVTAVGRGTRYGAIARTVAETAPPPSPLQRRMAALLRRIGLFALACAVAVFALERLRGHTWTESLLGSLSLAMAAVPEEFPLVLTLFLALGAHRLAKAGVLVRRLTGVEILGATSVLCTDKTGTLTLGQPTLARCVPLVSGGTEAAVLEDAALACEHPARDILDRVVVAAAAAAGLAEDGLAARWEIVRDHDFDPVGKHMAHVWRSRATPVEERVVMKGALEGVLEHCAPSAAVRAAAEAKHAELAAAGMRLLAVASSRRSPSPSGARADDEAGLELVGLLAFRDPLRPEAREAVAACRRAGIRLKIITGDHVLTARSIAVEAGIAAADAEVLTGADLARLPPDERRRRVAAVDVFARIAPEQKHLIVEDLQARGEIVAMTGDGINDAPALRRADIGVSMGARATPVARAAAGLVLLADDLGAIVAAVREGRQILGDLRRAFLYLIAFHIPIVGLALLAPLVGLPLLLLPVHLVWAELVVHPLSAVAFRGGPASAAALLDDGPEDPRAPFLPRVALVRSIVTGALLTAATLAIFFVELGSGAAEATSRAAALVTLFFGCQLVALAERGTVSPGGGGPWRLPREGRFWWTWALTGLALPLSLAVPALADLLDMRPPDLASIAAAAAAGAVAVIWRFVPRGRRPRAGGAPTAPAPSAA
jgi:Ca2+-transporting ATPase